MALSARGSRRIIVVTAPGRTRGCAEIGYQKRGRQGEAMVIAISAPSRFRMKRFSRVFEHEIVHTLGSDHEDMPERVLWSLGDTPDWAQGLKLRYRRRAPSQIH